MRRVLGGIAAIMVSGALVQCKEPTSGPDGPFIALSTQAIAVTGPEAGESPAPVVISLSNEGPGDLTGLEAAVAYAAGQPTGWLTATLDTPSAPTLLTLTAATDGLAAGQYAAVVEITSNVAINSPDTIDVALIVSDPLDTWASVFVRSGGTCGLMTVSAAFCWGANTLGQVGDGTRRTRSVPTPVVGGLTFTSLATGKEHTCGLTPAGEAYCWGSNQSGRLGDSSRVNRPVPTAVTGGLTFATLVAGKTHTCGVTTTGAAYCWGENEYGQLGDGTRVDRLIPTAVFLGEDPLTFAGLTAGDRHTCGVTVDGVAYCWGDNQFGARGDSTRTSPLNLTLVAGGLSFASLVAGGDHTCGLTADGTAYCWGANDRGQLGDSTTVDRLIPSAVSGGIAFTGLTAGVGGSHTCGLAATGVAYCWGENTQGQLGDGTVANRLGPTEVIVTADAGEVTFASLSAGGLHTCGVTTEGGVAYCWGSNVTGELGDDTRSARLTPVKVVDP